MGFRRDLYSIDDDLRRQNRRQILAAGPEDVRKTAQRLLEQWDQGVSVVLGGSDLAEAAAQADSGISVRIEIPFK